jgi:hypothetical protein
MRKGRKRRSRAGLFVQFLSLTIVAGLGMLLVSMKLQARPALAAPPVAAAPRATPVAAPASAAPAVPRAKPGAGPVAAAAPPAPSGAPAPSAEAPSAEAAKAEAPKAAAPEEGGDEPTNVTLEGTVIQTKDDFPEGISDEQMEALGTGKVPIHREGKFRSPLANPKHGGPVTVKVGLVVSEIREYDIQTATFGSDFFLSFTGDGEMPKLHPIFTNGREVNCTPIVDSATFKFYRCSGTFTSAVDLRDYPFDTQYLDINVEDAIYGVDTIVFTPDPARTSLDAGFRLAGYGVASVGANSFKHQYPPRFDRDDLYVSRYKFTIGVDRFAQSAAFSVYVPAFIIVLISLIGLWVPPSELEVRSNAGAPMLAAAVLFHYSLIQALPMTGYLTHADKLMLGVYVSLLLNMATTWGFMLVEEDKYDDLFRFFRAWVPPLTFVVMVMSVIA